MSRASIITGTTYNSPKFKGNIAGLPWRSIGDWEHRKYTFSYDAAGRLLNADFTQFPNADNQYNLTGGMDYTVQLGDVIHPYDWDLVGQG